MNTKYVVYKDARLVKETSNRNVTTGDFDSCVVMSSKFNETVATASDIFEVLRGDELKCEIFKAKPFKTYDLKDGMEFFRFEFYPPNQAWTFYAHWLPDGNILAFLTYSWNSDKLSKFFLKLPDKKINNAFDLADIDVTCHDGAKVFNSKFDVASIGKATWTCRVSRNTMSKEDVQKYFSKISNKIVVDSVNYVVNNGGMHSFTCRGYDLYDMTIGLSIVSPVTEPISIREVLNETSHHSHIKKGNKVYLLKEDYEPMLGIFNLDKDGVMIKYSAKYAILGSRFLGKKLVFKDPKALQSLGSK